MKQIPYIPFYIQDWLGSPDVQMMSMEDLGCFFKLMLCLYNNGGTLPNDPEKLKRLCGGIAVALPVLDKFYAVGEFLRNERADIEIKKYQNLSKVQSENARKRWGKPKSKNMPPHMPSHMPRECQSESESDNKKEYKEKSFEHPVVQNLWKILKDECAALGMQHEVNPVLFEKTYFEFENRLPTGEGFGSQLKKCLFHHKDKAKRKISAPTIRNWMLNAVKFAKEADLKRKAAFKDQMHTQDSIRSSRPVFDELEDTSPDDF